MSLSKVARGKINIAAQIGDAIPEGLALDSNGLPTTDAQAALAGTMLPMGDAKGAQLVLMVEILAAALSASHFGYEASSFFTGEGDQPRVGQFLLAIDPNVFSGNLFAERLEDLLTAILSQPGTRLPGERRFDNRRHAEANGVVIPSPVADQLRDLSKQAELVVLGFSSPRALHVMVTCLLNISSRWNCSHAVSRKSGRHSPGDVLSVRSLQFANIIFLVADTRLAVRICNA